MNELPDVRLLGAFAGNGDEAAFRELVARHTDLVYSAALRQLGSSSVAADVAQTVFTDLARKADTLARGGDATSLVGWLHRATRFAVLNQLRDDRRRRDHERQAMEQRLTDSEPSADWTQIAPMLDEALDSLGDDDREAVLLRYFKNQDFRAVGLALGVSDDTAQKRVSRAVEKLNEFFSKKKVTIGAASLGILISANAVQSAPAGLAAAMSSTALAGAAVSTSTLITATKTIAMTTLQKILITATVAALAGASIYEVKQAHDARAEMQAFQLKQAPLADQVRELQKDLADATNRLAAATAEVAQLKSSQSQAELLKLRGQVGTLRQQLTFMQAKMGMPSSGLEKLMADPVMKAMVNQQAQQAIKLRYADLFHELKLTPDQIEKFATTFANSGLRADGADVDSQLESFLGDAGYARFKEFTQEVPARTVVKLLDSQLGTGQLTDDQNSQLLQTIKGQPYNLTYGIEGDLNEAFLGTQDQVDSYVRQVDAANQQIVQQAGAYLSPDQLAALNTVLTNSLNARVTQATALTQKH